MLFRFTLLFLSFTCFLGAQEHSPKNLFAHLVRDQARIWSVPFEKSQWQSARPWLFLGLVMGSQALDGSVSRELRTSDVTQFNSVVTSRELDLLLATLPMAVALSGYAAGNPRLIDFGWVSSEAVVNAFFLSKSLKLITQRSRPHRGKRSGFWNGGNSFPSGHSAVAWALAAATAQHFQQKKWVPWLVYPLAGMISFSRVTSGNHVASDVVTGSAIGFLVGNRIAR
ncbi:MAG: phosphatase PAP2 family protein [Acidobacteria bacterium]|nr:phosphatase PAP2 family protein [Acidobacteriota bacterium]